MTTFHHTPIPQIPLQEAAAPLFNSRFSSLDSGIDDALSFGVNNNAELAAARGGYASLAARLNEMIAIGSNIATQANGAASAGQKNVTVDSTTGFVATAYVAYTLAGGTIEYNTIASITPSTLLVLGTNIGTGGIADNTYIAMISPAEYQAANAIHHGSTSLTLPQAMEYAAAGRFNVRAYGASPSASQSANLTAFQAAIDAAKAVGGGTVEIPPGTYAISGSLNLCNTSKITLAGTGNYASTILECHNTGKAAIECLGSKQLTFKDFQITGHATDKPAVGFWFGRSTVSVDTSNIWLERIHVYGVFTTAAYYNTGCESVRLFSSMCYLTTTSSYGGYVSDWHNTAGTGDTANSLTPEHTTINTSFPSVMSVLDKSFLTSDSGATNFIPLIMVNEADLVMADTYMSCWGAPAIRMIGACRFTAYRTGLEGTATYGIYATVHATYGAVSVLDFLDVALYGSSGYAMYFGDGTIVRDSWIRRCRLSDDVRFDMVEGVTMQQWQQYSDALTPALIVASYSTDCRFDISSGDAYTNAAANATEVRFHSDMFHPYTLFPGLAVDNRNPGADNQAVIKKMMSASATWNPGAVANGASAKTTVSLTGVVNSEPWVCLAYFSSISGYSGWDISAAIGDSAVGVVITNRSGGDITPASGTVTVIAIKIGET